SSILKSQHPVLMSQFPLLPLTTSINFLPFLLLFPSDIFLSSLLSFHQRYIIMLNKFRCCIPLFKLFMLDYFFEHRKIGFYAFDFILTESIQHMLYCFLSRRTPDNQCTDHRIIKRSNFCSLFDGGFDTHSLSFWLLIGGNCTWRREEFHRIFCVNANLDSMSMHLQCLLT